MSEETDHHDDLPGNFRRVLERFAAFAPALRAGADPAAEISRRVADVEEIFDPFDAVHLLGQFIYSETTMSDDYVESEHSGAAYIVELVAAILTARPSRTGGADPEPAIDANTTKPTRELLQDVALLEGLRRHQALGSSTLGAAQARTAAHNLMVRGPSWPEQERELLLDLFAPKHLADALHERLGFDAAEAVACVEALADLVNHQLMEHKQRAWAQRAEAKQWMKSVLVVKSPLPAEALERMAVALWALQTLGESLIVTPAALAEAADLSLATVEALVARLSTAFGQTGDVFQRAERVRYRPYLDLGDGRFLPTVLGNDLWALRGVFQEALRESDAYIRHRGRWLERRAGSMLKAALKPDEAHYSVGLWRGQLKLGDVDALLRFGDTVITLEAKSATMRPSGRRGGDALLDHLKSVVKKASEQADLARRALTGQEQIELRDETGNTLAITGVREVQPIVVTLDDISSVAPVLWQLIGSKLLPAEAKPPWVVTVYELDLVARIVQWPMQLIHFLRRRARVNEIGGLHAADELDWWMLYLNQGLYFEEDEQLADSELRYLSQTDALDAWYLSEHGRRSSPAPKPKQQLDEATEEMLDFLADVRPDGWVPAGCALLDVSSETRLALHEQLRRGRERAAERGAAQRGTLGFGDALRPFLICWVVCPDAWRRELPAILEALVAERLDQLGVQPVTAFGLSASSPRPLDALLVVEQGRW
jgi:hypothetical protein